MNSSNKDIYPNFSRDFLEFLDEIYPNRVPSITMTDREIWIKVGQRSVVDYLKSIKDEESELPTILNR
jgi:hypothetical protein